MKFKGFVSDMDGVVADTETFGFLGMKKLLQKNGISFTKEDYKSHIGKTAIEDAKILKSNHEIHLSEDDLKKEIKDNVEAEVFGGKIKLNTGYKELLEILKKKGVKISLASSSSKEKIKNILVRTGIENFFEVVVSAEEVGSKLDAYKHAVKTLGVSSHECFALEDSPAGAGAAKLAGLYCVVIPSEFFAGADFSFADEIHNSIPEFLQNGKVLKELS